MRTQARPGRALRRGVRCTCVALVAVGLLTCGGREVQQPTRSPDDGLAFLEPARASSAKGAPPRLNKADRPLKARSTAPRPATASSSVAGEVMEASPAVGFGDLEGFFASLPSWVWRLTILGLTMVWATNFAIIKEITAQPDVTTQLYAVSRFTLAAIAFAPFLFQILSSKMLPKVIECGVWVAIGYIGQAVGLMTTSAAKSCFICSLNVVFVALVMAVTTRVFEMRTIAAAVLATIGVGFLELAGSQQFVVGDLISLSMPICFGMSYIRLEEIMKKSPGDAMGVTATKLLLVAIASWVYYASTIGGVPDFSPVLENQTALNGVLWTGLIATALSIAVETVCFRYVDAASACVIFTTEPLWAALFAVWLISEPFSAVDGVGGALVVMACLIKEAPKSMLPWEKDEEAPEEA